MISEIGVENVAESVLIIISRDTRQKKKITTGLLIVLFGAEAARSHHDVLRQLLRGADTEPALLRVRSGR